MSIFDKKIVKHHPSTLLFPERALQVHSKKQLRKLAASVRTFGWVKPVLIDRSFRIIAGVGMVKAAILDGIAEVPTLMVDHLSPDEARAYAIADTQLAKLANWDDELVALEIAELKEITNLDFNVLGFDAFELDRILDVAGSNSKHGEPPLPALDRSKPAITRMGDQWHIGAHRLLCGDALEPASYEQLLGKELADMAITDPPFNVRVKGHVCVSGTQ